VLKMARRYVYERMTAAQLSQALDELGLTMRQFARLYGSAEKRIQQWLDGADDIPHTVAVVLGLLTLPGAMELAKRITDERARDSRDG
jgi:DNA-binding transcriptional regulator YiaG